MAKLCNNSALCFDMQDLAKKGIDVEEVPRGGEVTFHGPGQLVVYPIAGIRDLKMGARAWVEGLEDCIVDIAALYGVEARVRGRLLAGSWKAPGNLSRLSLIHCSAFTHWRCIITIN